MASLSEARFSNFFQKVRAGKFPQFEEAVNWDYISQYHTDTDLWEEDQFMKRRMWIRRGESILGWMILFGATREEILQVLRFMLVCLDAYKQYLDFEKAYVDFGFESLWDKYIRSIDYEEFDKARRERGPKDE